MITIYFINTMSTLGDEGYITDTRTDSYLYTEHEDESYLYAYVEGHLYTASISDTLITLHAEANILQHDYG